MSPEASPSPDEADPGGGRFVKVACHGKSDPEKHHEDLSPQQRPEEAQEEQGSRGGEEGQPAGHGEGDRKSVCRERV